MNIVVHPRVFTKRPEITQIDVECAILRALRSQDRPGTDPLEYIRVGPDTSGRLLQWVAIRQKGVDSWFVFHAMRVTHAMLKELGMTR